MGIFVALHFSFNQMIQDIVYVTLKLESLKRFWSKKSNILTGLCILFIPNVCYILHWAKGVWHLLYFKNRYKVYLGEETQLDA